MKTQANVWKELINVQLVKCKLVPLKQNMLSFFVRVHTPDWVWIYSGQNNDF